ncbi:unnamed protein product [Parnassius mnemosyne]|uniref:Uncharacterized protein n=1 Tax=Parnassius mnemosyne TaxID=213953 RepID=A0AAV1KNX2_9NEOP
MYFLTNHSKGINSGTRCLDRRLDNNKIRNQNSSDFITSSNQDASILGEVFGLSNDRVPRCALSGIGSSEHSWWYLSCSLVFRLLKDVVRRTLKLAIKPRGKTKKMKIFLLQKFKTSVEEKLLLC